jgi:glycosidase
MEFHISRAARSRYSVDETLFDYVGNVVFADVQASRRLADSMTEVRKKTDPTADVVNAGALFAMGLIDELSHALIAKYRATVDPKVLAAALAWFETNASPAEVDRLLKTFTERFPNTAINRGDETVAGWLSKVVDGLPNTEAAVEELLLLWLSNLNPAYKPFRELFDDSELGQSTIYPKATATLDQYFATRPPLAAGASLLDVLKAPMLASPDSLTGQLDYIREHWVEHLGDELRRVLLAIDTLKEEEVAIWMRFHPPVPGNPFNQDGPRDWGMLGYSGDEYLGLEEQRAAEARRRAGILNEYEAFSPDQAWMPTVVLIAKSTYVWLEQLSKKYGRHIHRLDQIPDEELRLLADRGLNGLWLIGLWERSIASQTIKNMRGQADAVASAYSLRDYRIADDLGGQGAYQHLRDRATAHGIRLASDMVPNHMGIDSTWVMEHPEWFVSRPGSPFPSYRFEGPDLSHDPNIEIKIEDHYFDQTDAAVVFRRRDRRSDHTEYVFHGNDGTTFAWNDTAQLDYSKAAVREKVIQTILEVARLFPIIRFDAAMTLAKKHVQRLWFPLPGEGGSIPSRAENAISQEEFDRLMPHEFWREVVDRVAVEVPGTLLLAEAFWLLEGYFVRTLGMHRVYNSAFMNMLRDEENAKYRSYLKKTIEFDPDILKRYVNFMSNPDERTAVDQFGSGDKYFGACTLMATLPGLPMFGHGQIEAYTERYGMEYKRAKMDEWPNEDLVARHQREIMPLLKNRGLFAESSFFRMYDFNMPFGGVDENVFAFSNREGGRRAVILFNNRYESTRGTIHWSVEQMNKGAGVMRGETLGDAIELPWGDATLLAYKDTASGLEYLRWSHDLRGNGLTLDLRGYQYAVLLDWRELTASESCPWDQLCNALQGAGVANLDAELSTLRLLPVHGALREALRPDIIQATIAAAVTKESDSQPAEQAPAALLEAAQAFLAAAASMETQTPASDKAIAASLAAIVRIPHLPIAAEGTELMHVLPIGRAAESSLILWAPVLAWAILEHLGAAPEERLAAFERMQLRPALAESFLSLGFEHEAAWRAAARVRTLLSFGKPLAATSLGLPDHFWTDGDVLWLTGHSEAKGKRYYNKERLEELFWWMALPTLVQPQAPRPEDIISLQQTLSHARSTAMRSGYEVEVFVSAMSFSGNDVEDSGDEVPELVELIQPAPRSAD